MMRVLGALCVGVFLSGSAFGAGIPCEGVDSVRIGYTVNGPKELTALIRELVPEARVEFFQLEREPDAAGEVDGFLSPGGKDIQFKYYRDQLPPELRDRFAHVDRQLGKHIPRSIVRDDFEIPFWRDYFRDPKFADIPALGICYGHQAMAVAFGYAMVPDLKTIEGIPARYDKFDPITFSAESPLAPYLPEGYPFRGPEQHHQAIYYPAGASALPGSTIFAVSNGARIPEGVTYAERPAYSIQFHPELSGDPVVRRAGMALFLERACAHARARKASAED